MSGSGRVVFRALMGGYEELREEEVARESEVPFICFTDDPNLTSETWEVVLVEPRLRLDRTRSSRALKIVGHPVLDEFEETLWVDNTVALKTPPDALFDEWLGDSDVAAPLHSYRTSVLAEAEAVIDAGFDDFARVYEQLSHYLADGSDVLEQNPHWTGMLMRRRTPGTAAAMQTWWEHVLRYSRRDQLSFLVAMRRSGIELRSIAVDNRESSWHEWPSAVGRDHHRLGSGLREALRPPTGRIGELEHSLDELTRTMTTTVAHREEVIGELEESLRSAESELARVAHDREVVRAERDAFETETEKLRERVARKERQVRTLRRELKRLRESVPPETRWSAMRRAVRGIT